MHSSWLAVVRVSVVLALAFGPYSVFALDSTTTGTTGTTSHSDPVANPASDSSDRSVVPFDSSASSSIFEPSPPVMRRLHETFSLGYIWSVRSLGLNDETP